MSVQPFYNPRFRAFDANGAPLAGGLLYTYTAGTSTPRATYTTRAGNVANANPVVLDANGEADVWTTQGANYKFVLKDSSGVVQWTEDNVPYPTDPGALLDGTVNAPSLTFLNDPDTGIYRIGANDLAITAGGIKVVDAASTGVSFPAGITATQLASNGTAITAAANGTGAGVNGQATTSAGSVGVWGSATTRTGVYGTATTGGAVVGDASGSGTGGGFSSASGRGAQGISTSDIGVYGKGGSYGGYFENQGGSTPAVGIGAGHLKMTGSNPSSSTGYANALTPLNIPKAWGYLVLDGAGNCAITGFNIGSVTVGAGSLLVNFATAMASANYAVICTNQYPNTALFFTCANQSASQFAVNAYGDDGSTLAMNTGAMKLGFVVFGAQ